MSGLIERRVIRVLVSYNRSNFFLKDGGPQGFEYELTQVYRKFLQKKVDKKAWPVSFVYIPVAEDQLLPALRGGWGDIVAAGLYVTPESGSGVAYSDPYIKDQRKVVVASPFVQHLENLLSLAGRRVLVDSRGDARKRLEALNEKFETFGLPAVEIIEADRLLSQEDLIELVAVGAIDLTIADSHVAGLWQQVFPDLNVRDDIVLHDGGAIAWAVRDDNPELLASLNEAIAGFAAGTLVGNVLVERYFGDEKRLGDPLGDEGDDRLARYEESFKKYGELYGFDWRFLAALAYQESHINQTKKSGRGAIGIMQILPETAAAEPISIPDITAADANIHAGTRYLAQLRDHFFKDLEAKPQEQRDFVLAAYNAGPSRIRALRRQAAKKGVDADRWFSGVDVLARRKIGRETVEYVANVNRYYLAYRLAAGREESRVAAMLNEAHPPPVPLSDEVRQVVRVGKSRIDFD